MVVGAETAWLSQAVRQVKAAGKHPIILSNQPADEFDKGVSRITEDILGSMNEIVSLFSARGHRRIALYACNPDSASDSYKKETFLQLGRGAENVFYNTGSLDLCFRRFYEAYKENRYGGIVCANDFAAVSLIRHMNDAGESIRDTDIISYSDTLIAKCTFPAISTVSASFRNFGHLAFTINDCLEKSDGIRGIKILCDWEIRHRETSSPATAPAVKKECHTQKAHGSFYSDPELMEMMRVETLLSECDETDLAIVDAILKGKTTVEIETSCFIRETAVKYRIKKMKNTRHAKSRSELRAILSKYLARDIGKRFSPK